MYATEKAIESHLSAMRMLQYCRYYGDLPTNHLVTGVAK